MSEENKAQMRHFLDEVFNNADPALIDTIFTPDYVDHSAPPGHPPGPEGVKLMYGMFRSAFPDLHVEVEDMIAEGDRVVVRATFIGAHQGEFMGIAPTGKTVSIPTIVIVKIRDGQFVERWEQADMLGMMRQLGAVPG